VQEPVRILAEGLGHPEGPDFLPDGGLVFAETYMSRIGVWYEDKGVSSYAECGGGPNACMLGSDGCVYITQNGGTVGDWVAEVRGPPSIQKASPDGKVEVIATEIDGITLNAPNDLSFGPDGRLYFTDSGVWDPATRPDPGYVFALAPDGSGQVLEELGNVYPNGICVEADGSVVWVESDTRKVRRRRPAGSREGLCELADGHIPDGLKVAENGDLWITTVTSGGLDIVSPDGGSVRFFETGGVPLNCVFRDASILITDFGTFDTSGATSMVGRLVEAGAGVRGMPLFRGAIG